MDKPSSSPHVHTDTFASALPLPTPEDIARRSERLLNRLLRLDFASFEGMPLAQALPNLIAGPAQELSYALRSANDLLEAMATLTGVPALPQLHGALGGAETPLTSFVSTSAPSKEGAPPSVHPDASALLEIELEQAGLLPRGLYGLEAVNQRELLGRLLTLACAQLCAATLALRAAQEEPTRWGLIGACEEARRQLRHVVRLTATASLRLTEPARIAALLQAAGPTCLGEALEARELLLSWRAEALGEASEALVLDNDALALALRELRLKLTHLFAQPSYPLLRMADRFHLRTLERRLSAWLDKPWTQFEEARVLTGELTRTLDQLVHINNRMVLVQHDCRVQAEVLGILHTLSEQRARAPDNVVIEPRLGAQATPQRLSKAGKQRATPIEKVVGMLWQVRWRSRGLTELLQSDSAELSARVESATFVERLMDVVEQALVS